MPHFHFSVSLHSASLRKGFSNQVGLSSAPMETKLKQRFETEIRVFRMETVISNLEESCGTLLFVKDFFFLV